jgi:hypothetical protein
MGARSVTLFPNCVFGLSANGDVCISNSSHFGDFPNRLTERLEYWAATAPKRVFLARRTEAGWREVIPKGDERQHHGAIRSGWRASLEVHR